MGVRPARASCFNFYAARPPFASFLRDTVAYGFEARASAPRAVGWRSVERWEVQKSEVSEVYVYDGTNQSGISFLNRLEIYGRELHVYEHQPFF